MDNIIFDYILTLIPKHLIPVFRNYLTLYKDISEIRVRSYAPITFTNNCGNIVTSIKVTQSDIDFMYNNLIDNNKILCDPILKQGYIPLKYNLRAGVCGDVFVVNNEIYSIRYVRSINIRLPLSNIIDCSAVLEYISSNNFSTSILVISPPGCGKTTLLRSLAYRLSSSPYYKRVAVIDTSRELTIPHNDQSIADHFSGYPKADGISIATRYFNPQYLICDEIGTSSEAKNICGALNAGVPIIASAHANDIKNAKLRKNIAYLLDKRIFNAAVEISVCDMKYKYNIVEL